MGLLWIGKKLRTTDGYGKEHWADMIFEVPLEHAQAREGAGGEMDAKGEGKGEGHASPSAPAQETTGEEENKDKDKDKADKDEDMDKDQTDTGENNIPGLGSIGKNDGSPPVSPATSPRTLSGAQEHRTIAHVHSSAVKAKIMALEMMPVQDPELLHSSTALHNKVADIKLATSLQQVQERAHVITVVLDSAAQLLAAIVRGHRDLQREFKKVGSDKVKKTEQAKKAAAEKKRVAADEGEMQALKKLTSTKLSGHFSLAWSEAGHPAVRVFADLAALGVALSTDADAVLGAPFVVSGDALFDKAMGTPESDKVVNLGVTMKKWLAKFPQSDAVRQADRVQAPLFERHGLKESTLLFDAIVPVASRVTGKLPSLESLRMTTNFYGWTATMVRHDWEHKYLGSIRVQTHGSCKVTSKTPEPSYVFRFKNK